MRCHSCGQCLDFLRVSVIFMLLICKIAAIVEPGYNTTNFSIKNDMSQELSFTKSMYPGTSVILKIECEAEPPHKDLSFKLDMRLQFNRCQQQELIQSELKKNWITFDDVKCNQSVILDEEKAKKVIGIDLEDPAKSKREDKPNSVSPTSSGSSEASLSLATAKDELANSTLVAEKTVKKTVKKVGETHLPLTKVKALYHLKMNFIYSGDLSEKLKFNVRIEAKHNGEYLSVLNWPLLPFYGVMSLVYLAYAIGWFAASCCNWRDLLRVQFWIGGVIAIGMFENALFYSEYQNINHTGKENGLLYFAEIVSCMKRALARILVIIVSMGFGIVKPRLGQMLHKVIAAGTLYFILGSIEGCIRVRDDRLSKTQMYALIPLTVLDVALCWWVFSSLVQTTRTLRIRKNVVKLTLYRHFTNTLIFSVIASLAYMFWTIKQNKFTNCIDIGTFWLNDALWPFLFALILAVIMILWRPSINNQRYAFTPLDLGDSEDDEEDLTLSEAFEGMKLRNKTDSNGVAPKSKQKAEDDLKWVEENIPSVPSTILPTIDSDEEILTTKFEISKMD